MECKQCGSRMGMGKPSSDKVKKQWECWCGYEEKEYFTEDEIKAEGQPEKAESANGGIW